MSRSDRLLALSTWRLALRSAGLDAPEAILGAAPEQPARLGRHRGDILRVVNTGNADVLRALRAGPQDDERPVLQHAVGVELPVARLEEVERHALTGEEDEVEGEEAEVEGVAAHPRECSRAGPGPVPPAGPPITSR